MTTPAEARMAVDLARAAILTLELDRRSGALVPLDAVKERVFAYYRSQRDAWLAWCSRAAPDMAIALGCTEAAVYTVLDTMVRKHIMEMSELELDDVEADTSGVGDHVMGDPEVRAGLGASDERIRVGGSAPSPRKPRQRRAGPLAD